MARPQATDFLQNFRFHASVIDSEEDYLAFSPDESPSREGSDGEAGFQSISMPEVTFEPTEYREGIYKYTRKYLGLPTWGESTFMRGVTEKDTRFAEWAVAAHGGGPYRADIRIEHFHREDLKNDTAEKIPDVPARTYTYRDAMPTRFKPTADLDSTSGEVSLQEFDVTVEWVDTQTED